MDSKPTEPGAAHVKILIVEDEVIIAMDLRQRLERFGYQVVGIAATGEQALQICERAPPDLVMMDIVLRGGLDGIETAVRINSRHDVPIVYLTAFGDEKTLMRARDTAPYGYLVKPYRPEEVRACIEVALYKHGMERQLRRSERWFAKTLHCVSDGVLATNEEGKVRFVNPQAARITGWQEQDALGLPASQVLSVLGERDRQPLEDPVRIALERRALPEQRLTGIVAAPDGRECIIEYGAAPIVDNDDALLGSVVALRDISHRRQIERALVESEERFHSAFDFAAIGMALVALDGRFLQLNQVICHVLGRSEPEVRGLTLQSVCHADDVSVLDTHLQALLTEGLNSFSIELRLMNAEARVTQTLISVSLVSDADSVPVYYIVQVQDITARRMAEARLTYLAQYDHLTGLYNRASLTRTLEQTLTLCRRQSQRVANLFVDLDNFKLINDTLGHGAGDDVLTTVARRLRGAVRETDLVGRFGGDEFVVVLVGIDTAETAQRVADKLVEAMQEPILASGQEVEVTFSIGVALFPDDATDAERLIAAADDAMYRAKELGKNGSAFYSRDWGSQVSQRMMLESSVRRAVTQHQFELAYQPIYDAEGRPRRVEALVRWRHPERGLIPPDEFIPLAERSGLIVPLGNWVLATACQEVRRWHQSGATDVVLAINVSARQFRDPKLVQTLATVLAETGIDPGRLELELTESAIMQQPERAGAVLRELRAMGVHLAVDDFGTGYSSLSYLKRLPFQTLKIDRSFVVDLPNNREAVAIVNAVITMSRELGLKVIAEGVETAAQFEFLRRQGCDFMQGYYLHRPGPAATISRLFGTP